MLQATPQCSKPALDIVIPITCRRSSRPQQAGTYVINGETVRAWPKTSGSMDHWRLLTGEDLIGCNRTEIFALQHKVITVLDDDALRDGAIHSVTRSLAALHCLNLNNGASPLQLSRALKIPRGTVYRILSTLAAAGYVRKDEHTGGYWLEEKVRDLSCGFERQDWILDDAEKIISELYSEFHWCLMLTAPERNEMLIRVATLKRNLQGGQRSIAGRKLSMSSGAGLTYLAFCPEDERDEHLDYIATHPKIYDEEENLSPDRCQLLSQLDMIRETGYHIRNKVTRARSINVPVMRNELPVGTLSMTFFASSVKHMELTTRYLPKLQLAAERLGQSAAAN